MENRKESGASGLKAVQTKKNIIGRMVSLMVSTQSGLKAVRKKLRVNIRMVKKMVAGQSTTLLEKKNQ